MVCDDVRRIAYFFLDEQLADHKRVDLEDHLHACRSCDDRLTIHRRLRMFIRRRLERVQAPGRLRERIHSALHRGSA